MVLTGAVGYVERILGFFLLFSITLIGSGRWLFALLDFFLFSGCRLLRFLFFFLIFLLVLLALFAAFVATVLLLVLSLALLTIIITVSKSSEHISLHILGSESLLLFLLVVFIVDELSATLILLFARVLLLEVDVVGCGTNRLVVVTVFLLGSFGLLLLLGRDRHGAGILFVVFHDLLLILVFLAHFADLEFVVFN